MSFEEEWASARTAKDAGVGMRLNRSDNGPAGGSGNPDLSVSQDRLGAIGSAAYTLHGRLKADGGHARASTFDAATMMTVNGFRTGAAMATVQETWNSQLNTLLDACANISNQLDYSAASHAKEEEDIKTSFAASKIDQYLR
ncbi:hypothetical protein [Streptomyces sp. SP18CS02]|uniref:hypothetical protein n=1 Tax=Streptomyces sp. SP18CS02 TaxID=3002531 RepID=UPI002E779C18|nr:hypothetical protein [Streptomyces sp. SP18CS02]MEE1752255.1 hypothetical protein [Streptomyces sp. SP18CS02]